MFRLHSRRSLMTAAVCCFSLSPLALRADDDLSRQLQDASKKLVALQSKADVLSNEGKLDQATQMILATFPEKARTPVEALAIANMIFRVDPKTAYNLHKEVAAKLPENDTVQLEWGIEQHRAGEYAGALKSYDVFSAKNPDFAPVHGLAAECLLRLGKTKEAVARWKKSEEAQGGSLETFETWVCDIHFDHGPGLKRQEWAARAEKGDVDAAMLLVYGDAEFQRDWWNAGPNRGPLTYDQKLLEKLPDGPRVKAAKCVCECLLKEDPDKEFISETLKKYGFLIVKDKTLPEDFGLLQNMIGAAVEAEVVTDDELRTNYGAKLLARAKGSKDAVLWNIVAYLAEGTPDIEGIEKEAWEETGDKRFAAGYFTALGQKNELKADNAELPKALKQFPEEASIQRLALMLTKTPSEAQLVQAIKAEYHQFSNNPGLLPRPGAKMLEAYFDKLGQVMAAKK